LANRERRRASGCLTDVGDQKILAVVSVFAPVHPQSEGGGLRSRWVSRRVEKNAARRVAADISTKKKNERKKTQDHIIKLSINK